MCRARSKNPAIAEPMSGPMIGTGAYPQSDPPLPGTGSRAWAMRGPKSRAGLIAYPVVAPSDRPIPQTSAPTRYGPKPAESPFAATAFENIAPTENTRTNVPEISLIKFHPNARIAGAVQQIASFAP